MELKVSLSSECEKVRACEAGIVLGKSLTAFGEERARINKDSRSSLCLVGLKKVNKDF